MDDQQKKLAEELLFSEKKKAGFAKKLYFGAFDTEAVFPYPSPPLGAEAFLLKVKSFVETQVDGDEIDRHSEIPDGVIRGLGELGLLGMTIPEAYGGLGMSQYAYCRAAELVSKQCASTALFINAHQSIGLKALLLFGTEEQKKKWLPLLAKGEKIAAFSLTEPNAGSDASGVETHAVYHPEKKCYIINGKKQWTTNGGIAGVLTVMAQTEMDTVNGKEKRITAFLVTPDMPGFRVTASALEKVGMRGTKTANLAFENLEVPVENVLGPIGGGLKVCLTVLDYGRTTFGAACTGAAKFLLEKAIEHAKTRYQFKRPLASFSLVKEKITRMASLVYAMDATTYLTAGLIDQGVEDFMLEAAILKVFASDALWKIIYETMQIYGGRSFFTDHPFERMMRDGRLNMIGEGSNEVLRAFIGVVGMRDVGIFLNHLKEEASFSLFRHSTLKKLGKIGWSYLQAPHIPIQSKELQPLAYQLGCSIRRFGWAVVRVLYRYREEVLEKQLVLNRIADSAIAIYTATAVLGKLDRDIQSSSSHALSNDFAIATFYCREAMDMVNGSLSRLFDVKDDEIERISDLLTKK